MKMSRFEQAGQIVCRKFRATPLTRLKRRCPWTSESGTGILPVRYWQAGSLSHSAAGVPVHGPNSRPIFGGVRCPWTRWGETPWSP